MDIKKVFDDKIGSLYFNKMPTIYRFIESEKKNKFFDYFLERIDNSYNFWLLLIEVLSDYTWQCYLTKSFRIL